MREVPVGRSGSMPARPSSPCVGCSRRSSPTPARARRLRHPASGSTCWPAMPGREARRLDLFADISARPTRSATFAGPAEGGRYPAFCAGRGASTTRSTAPFIRAAPAEPAGLVAASGLAAWAELWQHPAVRDPVARAGRPLSRSAPAPAVRPLRHLCGSSPFHAPATLMLVAHVEQEGVWQVEGGMHRLAEALASLAGRRAPCSATAPRSPRSWSSAGGRPASAGRGRAHRGRCVVFNGDAAALASGRLGPSIAGAVPADRRGRVAVGGHLARCVRRPTGFPLCTATTCSSPATTAAEFDDVSRRGRLPADPTVYVCAQDRGDRGRRRRTGRERLLCLVNAPPTGDTAPLPAKEIEQCAERRFGLLARCGLRMTASRTRRGSTTPTRFRGAVPGDRRSAVRPGLARLEGVVRPAGSPHAAPGPVSGGGQRASGPGRADGGAVGPDGGGGAARGPRFDRHVPAGGYPGGTSTR